MHTSPIQKALSFLARRQHKNGGWSTASVFPTALITACLAECSDAENPMALAVDFLLSQRGSDWSWNYSAHKPGTARKTRYPDDLDDTSCALLALCKSGAWTPDGEVMARFVEHLIIAEQAPGGPYRTWIIGAQSDGRAPTGWNDVDTAVNATIGAFLSLQGVSVPGLHAYLDRAVLTDTFSSLYYHDHAVIRYFLARFYATRKTHDQKPDHDSKSVQEATTAIARTLQDRLICPIDTPLRAALVLTSLLRLGETPENPTIQTAADCIRSTQRTDGSWPASPLYIEEIGKSGTKYMQSPELTTSFCIEALCILEKASNPVPSDAKPDNNPLSQKVRTMMNELFSDGPFADDARNQLARLDTGDLVDMIALHPVAFARAAGIPTNSDDLAALGCANLLGWIGYTIQDDIMDENRDHDLLPFSNVCMRESYRIFSAYLDQKIVRSVFSRIDTANAWEAVHSSTVNLRPPDYGDASILAEKSLGHALGPLAVLFKAGHTSDSQAFKAIEQFFIHYLIVRQLNDDAHDWEQDLAEGRVNAAIAPIWTAQKSISDLKDEFWNGHIEAVCADIFKHAKTAIEFFEASNIALTNEYAESLLAPLVYSAKKALSERAKTFEFLASYIVPASAPRTSRENVPRN